jgi:hypothetical protein
MNVYIADGIARQHNDALLADAAAARRVRRARRGGKPRSATVAPTVDGSVEQTTSSRAPRSGAVVAHVISWPFSAARNWLAAGYL